MPAAAAAAEHQRQRTPKVLLFCVVHPSAPPHTKHCLGCSLPHFPQAPLTGQHLTRAVIHSCQEVAAPPGSSSSSASFQLTEGAAGAPGWPVPEEWQQVGPGLVMTWTVYIWGSPWGCVGAGQ
jgi:hypothetical protein